MAADRTPGTAERRAFLEFLLDEYNARAALIDGAEAAFFAEPPGEYDTIDESCRLLGEVGVIHRKPGALHGRAPRLDAAILAADRALPATVPAVLIFGAGQDTVALAAALVTGRCRAAPDKVTVAGMDAKTLNGLRAHLATAIDAGLLEIRHAQTPAEHDRLLALLPPGSAIVNAIPAESFRQASPISTAALFPEGATAWDLLNGAGRSAFLAQAIRQRDSAALVLRDGANYAVERWVAALSALFMPDAMPAADTRLREAVTLAMA